MPPSAKTHHDLVLQLPPTTSSVYAIWHSNNKQGDHWGGPIIAGLHVYHRDLPPPKKPFDGSTAVWVPLATLTHIGSAQTMLAQQCLLRFKLANPETDVDRDYDLELFFKDQDGTPLTFKDGSDFIDLEGSFQNEIILNCLMTTKREPDQ